MTRRHSCHVSINCANACLRIHKACLQQSKQAVSRSCILTVTHALSVCEASVSLATVSECVHLCRKYEAQVIACQVRCDEATASEKKMQRGEANFHSRLAEVDHSLPRLACM